MAQRGHRSASAVDPSVLLMDEPFASVDAYTRVRLQDELLQVMKRQPTTVLFVTHDVGEAVYLGDRVVVMSPRPGRVIRSFDLERPPETGPARITLRRSRRSSISSSSAAELSARASILTPEGTPMPLAHDSDQSIFADSIERFLSGLPAEETVETLLAGDSPPAPDAVARVWAKFQAALEPIGLPLPDDLGGTGASWREVGLVLEATGRHLAPMPYASVMTAVRLLEATGEPDGRSLLTKAAAGRRLLMVVPASSFPGGAVGDDVDFDGTVLTGCVHAVLDAPTAEVLLCPVMWHGAIRLAVADATHARVEGLPAMDLTRALADLHFEQTPARLLETGDVGEAVRDALGFAATGVALEAIGGGPMSGPDGRLRSDPSAVRATGGRLPSR